MHFCYATDICSAILPKAGRGSLMRRKTKEEYADSNSGRQRMVKKYCVCRVLQENNDVRSALSTSDVVEFPTQAEIKTLLHKVKDIFAGAEESFRKLTTLNSTLIQERILRRNPRSEGEESRSHW